ncbi:miRNA mediated inhibition of translation, partial [Branchiostoma belcheri]
EIQKAYLTVAIQYHPDRTENQDGKNSATFEKINAAYREVISDEDAENVDSDQVFFNLLEELLLSDSEVTDVYSWFSQSSPGFSPDDMYIDDVDDDAADRGFDTFMDIVHNRRLNGKQVPEGFTDEKLSYLKDTLAEEKEAHKRENAKRLNSKKSKTVLPVPVAKPKPKSKKQLKAEQRRREKEMEEIAHDLKEKAKEEELRAEKKKQQELEKQKRLEEEYIKAAQEEKKRKEKEAEELRLQMEEEEEQRQEEERRKREEKKKKQQQLKAKAQELKAKEAESAKSQPSQAAAAQQAAKRPSSAQGQQPPRYPREVPPRFQQQAQKQQHHKQKQQGGQGKKQQDYYKGSGDNDFSMWNDTGSSWDRVVVDGKDKESWPSLNNESETTSEVDDSLSNAGSDKSASNSSSVQGLSQHSDNGQRDDSSLSPRDTDLSSGNATPSASSSGPLNDTIANANPRGMNGNTDSVWGVSSSAKTVSTSGAMSVWGMQGAATNVSNVNSSVWGGNPHGFPNVQNNNDNSVVARDANSGTSNSMFMGMWDSDSNSDGNYQQNVLQLGRKEAAQQQPPPHVFGVHNALPQTINNPGSGPNNTQNYGNPQVNANAAMESAKCELLPVSNGWLGGFSTAGEANPGAPGHNTNLVDGPMGLPAPPASNPGNTSAASTNPLFGGSNMNTSVAGTADSANAANITTTNMGNNNPGNQSSRTEPNAWSRPLSGADWGNPSRAWGNTNPTPGGGGSGWGSPPPPPQMPNAAPQVGPSGWGDSNPRAQENSWANAAKKGMAPENFTNGASKSLAARPNPDSELRAKIDSTTSWGKTPVKQDTVWAVADSPEEKRADDGTAIWGRPSAASGGRDWDDKNWDDNKGGGGGSWGGGGGPGPAQPPPPSARGVDNGTAEPSPPTMRRMMAVDNGTAAWGDPEAHNRRVSELGKREHHSPNECAKIPREPPGGTKGWSEPPPTPSAFKPSGWGDTPTSAGSPYDKGTSIWGGKTSSSSWGDPGEAAWGTSVSSATHSKSGSESMQDGWGTEGEGSSTPGWEEDEAFGTWSVSASQESNSSYGSGGWTNSAKPVVKDSSMWNNRQLKQLVDMGFPREDAEKALKTNNNNLESAIGVLLQKNGVESNSHLDSDSGKDNRNTNRVLPVGRQKRFSSRADDQIPVTSHDEDDSSAFIPISQPNQILKNPSPIPPGQQAGMNKQGVNYNFSLNQNSGAMSSITSSSATPTLPKGGGGGGGGGVGFNPQQPLTPPMNPNQPIRGQMNPLVFQQQMQQHMQMLQMAARNGFLNQALLNPQVAAAASANSGPMSQQVTSLTPQQLKLVQQLLQLSQLQNQQKVLNQQLLQYQGQPGGGTGKGSLNHLQRQQQELAMLIQQMQQQIVNQQRLIAQQSLMQQKQSQKPDHHFGVEPRDQEPRGVGNNVASALGNLNLNVDAGMKEPPLSQSTMQSRLNQWKHPSHQPRDVDSNDDFARKPGAIGRSRSQNNSAHGYGGGPYDSFPPEDPLNHTTVTSPIMSTQSDTWAAISPSPTDASSRSSSQQWSSAIDADLSSMLPPEFKPGEPWKGLKDYANDPDVTPGSVARSISLNMVKDSDILKLTGEQYKSSKDDPASSTSALLSSTTWSFSGSSLYSNTSASGSNKGNVKSTWSSASPLSPSAYPPSTITNEIWRAPLPSKKGVVPARPPPGLNVTKSSMWSSGGGGGRGSSGDYNVGGSGGSGGSGWGSVPSMWSGGDTAPPGRQAPSNWLILKNLTPQANGMSPSLWQIDGSTLRTLCMQHGPLLTFHLNLSQGCALVCYMSKEEAAKAQKSLHTCVLGNTTILADFISEDEARRLFEQNNSQAAAASSANDRYNPDRYNVNPSFGGRGDAQHYIGGRGDAQTYPGRGENQSYGTRGGENRGYGGRGDAQAAYGRRNDPPPFSGPPPSDSHWNGSSSVGGLSSMIPGNSMWSIQAGSSGGGGWGTGNDTDARGVVSPNALSTLLPGDLLGGENM